MTIAIATAAQDVGYLSLDTLHYSYHQFDSLDAPPLDGTPEAAFRAAWSGDGKPPKVDPLDFAPKVHALPGLKMAVGYAGHLSVGLGWVEFLKSAGKVRCIDELEDIAPEVLARIAGQLPGATDAAIFHIGWSERQGRVVGRVFSAHTGYQVERFFGTYLSQPVHPDHVEHDQIINAVAAAGRGEDVEAFHAAIARNVEDAYRAGKALRWLHYGGELLTAKVDRHGVTIRPTYSFKGHAPLNVLAVDYRQDIAERLALAQLASLKGPMGQAVVRNLIAQNSAGGAFSSMAPAFKGAM